MFSSLINPTTKPPWLVRGFPSNHNVWGNRCGYHPHYIYIPPLLLVESRFLLVNFLFLLVKILFLLVRSIFFLVKPWCLLVKPLFLLVKLLFLLVRSLFSWLNPYVCWWNPYVCWWNVLFHWTKLSKLTPWWMRNCHRVGAFSAPEIHSSPTKMVAEKGGFHGDLMVIYSDLS